MLFTRIAFCVVFTHNFLYISSVTHKFGSSDWPCASCCSRGCELAKDWLQDIESQLYTAHVSVEVCIDLYSLLFYKVCWCHWVKLIKLE